MFEEFIQTDADIAYCAKIEQFRIELLDGLDMLLTKNLLDDEFAAASAKLDYDYYAKIAALNAANEQSSDDYKAICNRNW